MSENSDIEGQGPADPKSAQRIGQAPTTTDVTDPERSSRNTTAGSGAQPGEGPVQPAADQGVDPEDSIEQLMAEMTNRRIHHFPVVRDGRLCGIVSIGDVVKNRLGEVEYEARSLRSFIAGAWGRVLFRKRW